MSGASVLDTYMAAALFALGLFQLAGPKQFTDVGVYFRAVLPKLEPWERLRLSRVLASRIEAEGPSHRYIRIAGVLTMAIAAMTLLPGVPYTLPFAAACLVMATAVAAAYAQIHRATQRRAAPLARRSSLRMVSPWVIPAPMVGLAAAAVVATAPSLFASAVGVAVATVLLVAIAWRASLAPALLCGDDPQLEYDVDQEVRRRRVNGILGLAGAPGYVLFALTHTSLGHAAYLEIFYLVVAAAFFSALLANRSTAKVTLNFA